MLFIRRVNGNSMHPTLRHSQVIIGSSRPDIRNGNIVIAMYNGREVIKRITKVSENSVWIEGDNTNHSTDSRNFGWVSKNDILGTMKYSLPIATDPPKIRKTNAPLLGWIAASILIVFSLIHLFRIDTFVPELALVFGGNQTTTFWVASVLVTMEVFALPFLMRMRLSPLAHYVSGAFAVIVPLVWTLVAIWTNDTGISTAQLGEFVSLPGSQLLIAANAIWLAFSYYTIWALGYDHRPNEKKSFVSKMLSRLSK